MKRLAVITACVMTGYEFTRLHAAEQRAKDVAAGLGSPDDAASQPPIASFECRDFWAWEDSPVQSDRVRNRGVGFYSADDVSRWEGQQVRAVRCDCVCTAANQSRAF
jgi:hypothetical protein